MWQIPAQRANQLVPHTGAFVVQAEDTTPNHLIVLHPPLGVTRQARARFSVHDGGDRSCHGMRKWHSLIEHTGVLNEGVVAP